MSEPQNIRIYRITDIPGYEWEINWLDGDGEDWSEECETSADLLERIRDILMGDVEP